MTEPSAQSQASAGEEMRARVLATLDKQIKDLIVREKARTGEPVVDVATLKHVRRLMRMQVGLLSWMEARDHNAQVAAEAMAEPARPDSREELQALIDARRGAAYCQRCHDGDCYTPPALHAWVDHLDEPGLPDPVPAAMAARLADAHPCACDCARGAA